MMWIRSQFLRAVDAHVTGLNDPYAPFNQDPGLHPICEKCLVEECLDPCKAVLEAWEEEYMAQRKADRALYLSWLMDLSYEEALKCHDEVLTDWVGLRNMGLIVEEGPQ